MSDQVDSANLNSKKEKTCLFFMKGICKYGIVGKECKYSHPKMCDKLLKHGTRQPHGCNLGKKCTKFHPKMCSSSITKSECFDEDCKFKHVRGTKREQGTTKSNNKPGNNASVTVNSKTNGQNDFLEALRLMKAELMGAMDSKLAMVISQLQQPHPQPFYPPHTFQLQQNPLQSNTGPAHMMWHQHTNPQLQINPQSQMPPTRPTLPKMNPSLVPQQNLATHF